MPDFVHLHCHSEYSIKNSTIRIKALVEQVKTHQFKAIGLTDEFNVFAALKFYQACIKQNIKPIFGAELSVVNHEQKSQVLLLCQTYQGYQNLSQLISECYLHHQSLAEVFAPIELVKKHSQDLIMITPAVSGDVAQLLLSNQFEQAKQTLEHWKNIFPNRYYMAVQRTGRANDEAHLALSVKLALQTKTAIVATNAVQFLTIDDFEAHEVKTCIASGNLLDDDRRVRLYSPEQYLKSPQDMIELFEDLPEAISNSVNIAKRCNVKFSLFEKNYLPEFPTPKAMTMADFFTQEAQQGLSKRIENLSVDKVIYQKRLLYEIGVILKMDFPGYFLIVADFIAYAKQEGIPVGPGRGSGAGSLVAYVLGITNVDPIYHDLLFERFLNPDRVSMPDFDIDFCTNRRDEVIAYVAKKYGNEKVSQIITYGTMAAKGVVRDVGRVLGHPYGFSDSLSKLIPNELKMTLDKALKESPDFLARYERDEASANLIDIAKTLEGLSRNVGTHAGGVVIAPSKISDFCPIYKGGDQSDSVVSQFDKDDLEAVGLVKFDFLGLSNLTVIKNTLDDLEVQKATPGRLDLDNLALDDKKVYELLQEGNTTGIFQLESEGMRAYLKNLKPDKFEDIVAMLALYRPGPLESGMVEDYIEVKNGKKKAQYPHPMLKEVLEPTNGGFLYQEQVMKAAQVMSGYTLAQADILRRVMGKKKEQEMKAQRSVFVKGAVKNKVNEKQANEIFDLIDKFSGYGFNKSHSVAYALVSYQTAYLKAHYPVFFMAAVLSGMMGDTDRVAFSVSEIRQMKQKVEIVPPNVNLSHYKFSVNQGKIVYGLGAIKGVGQALVEQISLERKSNGSYDDLVDFCCRIDKRLLNRRALEALILCGAFDEMSTNRHELMKTFPTAVSQAEQYQKDKFGTQAGLFGEETSKVAYQDIIISTKAWQGEQTLRHEKTVMGYFFSGHPSEFYSHQLTQLKAKLPHQATKSVKRAVRLLGLISDFRIQEGKKGRTALFNIGDKKQEFFTILSPEATIKLESIIKPADRIKEGDMVLVSGELGQNFKKDKWQVRANSISKVDEAIIQSIKNVAISLKANHSDKFQALSDILLAHKGDKPVYIQYQADDNLSGGSSGVMPLHQSHFVKPDDSLKIKVQDLLGAAAIRFN